jgi:adenylylsulfate kinase-like enzyme
MKSAPPHIATTAETAAARRIAPQILVLMGVSGSGKSTIALELPAGQCREDAVGRAARR